MVTSHSNSTGLFLRTWTNNSPRVCLRLLPPIWRFVNSFTFLLHLHSKLLGTERTLNVIFSHNDLATTIFKPDQTPHLPYYMAPQIAKLSQQKARDLWAKKEGFTTSGHMHSCTEPENEHQQWPQKSFCCAFPKGVSQMKTTAYSNSCSPVVQCLNLLESVQVIYDLKFRLKCFVDVREYYTVRATWYQKEGMVLELRCALFSVMEGIFRSWNSVLQNSYISLRNLAIKVDHLSSIETLKSLMVQTRSESSWFC